MRCSLSLKHITTPEYNPFLLLLVIAIFFTNSSGRVLRTSGSMPFNHENPLHMKK
jgi:hypothetical protein